MLVDDGRAPAGAGHEGGLPLGLVQDDLNIQGGGLVVAAPGLVAGADLVHDPLPVRPGRLEAASFVRSLVKSLVRSFVWEPCKSIVRAL